MPVDHEDYLPGEAPAAHKETHQDGGTDEISIADLAGVSTELAAHALLPTVHQDAPALIALHQAIAAAHHVRYSDAEVTAIANGLIAAHTAIAAAHHARYTDAEAKVVSDAGIATHAALPTVHQDAPALILTHKGDATAHQDAPGLIATHKGDPTAHQDAPGLIATHKADVEAHHAYSFGTWTMGIAFGLASVNVTYSSNTGYYTKIGNVVTVSGYMVLTSKGTSVGAASITGLPIPIANNNGAYASASLRITAISFSGRPQGYFTIGNTIISLEQVSDAGIHTSLLNTDFADNSTLMVNGTYRI